MSIPFKYNLRNLLRRRLRTGLTITGITLVIAAVVIMLAFGRGMVASVRNNGEIDNLVVISKKAADRVFSSIKKGDFHRMTGTLGDDLAVHGEDGIELAAPFVHHTANLKKITLGAREWKVRSEAIIMGAETEVGPLMFRNFAMVQGKTLLEAEEEEVNDGKVIIVGALAYARLGVPKEALVPGAVLTFNDARWQVVGVFTVPGTSMESEIWAPLEELSSHLHRDDFSFGVLRAKGAAEAKAMVTRINTDELMPFAAQTEQTFFAGHAENFNVFVYIAVAMALVITIGGIMAGMNTMYTSIQGRIREFGTLQVLGFSRTAILQALLVESVLVAMLGGGLGCLLGSLVNGLPVQVTMGAFLFQVDGVVIGQALVLALVIGVVGALIPAVRAVRMRMVDAMRFN